MSEPEKNLPDKRPARDFATRESSLAALLGINRDVIRHLRAEHLQEGVHFARLAKVIHYTAEAVELLRKRLDLTPDELQRLFLASREKKAAPDDEDDAPPLPRAIAEHSGPLTLKVWRSFHHQNADGTKSYGRIIEAYRPNTDPALPANVLRVAVRSGQNYVRHMEIPARHLAGDLYECTRPDPRWRGCW